MKRRMLRSAITFIAASGTMLTFCACSVSMPGVGTVTWTPASGNASEAAVSPESESEDPDGTGPDASAAEASGGVTIVYTNDIHCHIANEVYSDPEDKTSETVPGLRLSSVAQMVKDLEADGKKVLLVDAGDAVQGGIYGAIDEGESIIGLMNTAGYDLATLGNHEFDYGMDRMFQLTDMAQFPYITCNFLSLAEDASGNPFEPCRIFEENGLKIAFVGITTPETFTSSTPVYFQDSQGNYIYDIAGAADPQDLYDAVQQAVDEVRDEADYVIALGHTGVSDESRDSGISSYDVIRNTSGFDAYIDGHSHTVLEGEKVQDREGKEVLLTQTGCYLGAVGEMTVDADGTITSKLITEYEGRDPETENAENELIRRVEEEMGTQIGVLGTTMYINDPENEDQRMIRSEELNLGDFSADSIYWFLNEDRGLDCDMAICNAGGIRTQLPAGPVTNIDIKNVFPFGNMICLIEATGEQIMNALEMGAGGIGDYSEERQTLAENDGLLHSAGIRYSIDTAVPSSVRMDEKGMFVSQDGEYRVKNVEVYNRESGIYEPIDLNRTYTVGGFNYNLRNGGSGLSMFMTCDAVVDYVGEDWEVLASYVKSFAREDDYPFISTENSPLASWSGYLLDYEDPYGSGRIEILEH